MTDVVASNPAGTPNATPGANGQPPIGGPGGAAPVVPAVVVPDAGPQIGDEGNTPAIKTELDTVGAVSYAATGDAGLDMALTFVGNLGLGPEDPAMAAAVDGNFALLKAKLAAMGDKAKGWEQYVALAEKAHNDTAAKTSAKVAADTKTIHEAVGGKEAWNAIAAWAASNAEPDEKVAVNAALAAGGIAAKAMAVYLKECFGKASGTVKQPATVVAPGAAAKPDSAGALSAVQYAKEVQTLRQTKGYGFENSAEYKNLQARREAGRRSGV